MCSIILSLLFAIFKRGFEPKLYFWIQRDWLLTICLWDFLHVFTLHTWSLFWPSVDLILTSRQHHYLLWQTQKLVSLSKSFPRRAKNSNRASVIHRFLPNTHTDTHTSAVLLHHHQPPCHSRVSVPTRLPPSHVCVEHKPAAVWIKDQRRGLTLRPLCCSRCSAVQCSTAGLWPHTVSRSTRCFTPFHTEQQGYHICFPSAFCSS